MKEFVNGMDKITQAAIACEIVGVDDGEDVVAEKVANALRRASANVGGDKIVDELRTQVSNLEAQNAELRDRLAAAAPEPQSPFSPSG